MDPIVDGVIGNAIWAGIVRFVVSTASSTLRHLKAHSPFKAATVCLRHRLNTREAYYEGAFGSGRDVLYVSIMSQDTLKEMKPLLELARDRKTRIRVLTWHRDTPKAAIECFRRHIAENADKPTRTVEQVKRAATDWRRVEKDYSNVTVREYESSPTMQGLIVDGHWAVIELLPYATHKNDRPALVLTPKADPELFDLFKARFEAMWSESQDQGSDSV